MSVSLLNKWYTRQKRNYAQKAIDVVTNKDDKKSLSAFERRYGRFPVLQPGDIILIRHKKGHLRRKLMRILTDSYWDHAALLLYPKKTTVDNSDHVILELKDDLATKAHYFGSSIHKLSKYSMRPDAYDIGIKRVPNLTPEEREQVRSYGLAFIDEPYYPFFRWSFLTSIFSPQQRLALLRTHRFSCSALIQKAYFFALSPIKRENVIFRQSDKLAEQLLELVSPADIATSTVATWLYRAK